MTTSGSELHIHSGLMGGTRIWVGNYYIWTCVGSQKTRSFGFWIYWVGKCPPCPTASIGPVKVNKKYKIKTPLCNEGNEGNCFYLKKFLLVLKRPYKLKRWMTVRQKVQKSYFQSQLLISKINGFFFFTEEYQFRSTFLLLTIFANINF